MHLPFRPLAGILFLSLTFTLVPAAALPDGWAAVDAAVLDQARGGFTLPSGLAVGIGIERTVTLNGEVVARTRFEIPDLRLATAEQALAARAALSSVTLVQNGAGGIEREVLSGTIGATVVQNSLDDQQIQTSTVIDASVNSLAGFKAINFQSSLGDALARAAGTH